MSYTPPPQYDASVASNLQNENQRLQQENAHLQQTLDNFRHDNRELKRMLEIAMNRESEGDTIETNLDACLKHAYAETKHIKRLPPVTDTERLARLLARLYENASPELRAIYRDDFNEVMNQPTQ